MSGGEDPILCDDLQKNEVLQECAGAHFSVHFVCVCRPPCSSSFKRIGWISAIWNRAATWLKKLPLSLKLPLNFTARVCKNKHASIIAAVHNTYFELGLSKEPCTEPRCRMFVWLMTPKSGDQQLLWHSGAFCFATVRACASQNGTDWGINRSVVAEFRKWHSSSKRRQASLRGRPCLQQKWGGSARCPEDKASTDCLRA